MSTHIHFPTVQERLDEFLPRHLDNLKRVEKLAGDASLREYYRCLTGDGHSCVLAAYPESFDEGSFSYREVYDLFREIGVSVPEIIAMDGALGFVLQEDLGDVWLQHKIQRASDDHRLHLLRAAVDVMLRIQDEGSEAIEPGCIAYGLAFDEEKLCGELKFFRKHFLGRLRLNEFADEDRLLEEFGRLARELSDLPRVLCHRDFHVRNLMVRDEELFLIDFQDARWGPASYDLASLLKDSLQLSRGAEESLIEYYLSEIARSRLASVVDTAKEVFLRQFHLMCIQRLLKALGTYGYQITVRNNQIYQKYIPGTLGRVMSSLRRIGEFPYACSLVEEELNKARPATYPVSKAAHG